MARPQADPATDGEFEQPGEFERIDRILAPLAGGALGLRDDAGLIPESGGGTLVSTDAMIEGVHFVGDERPRDLACKLLRVNLSDLAAMAARPLGYVLTLALRREVPADWLKDFVAGLAGDQDRFGLTLIGGDSVSTPGPIMLSVTVFGTAAPGAMLRRDGVRCGDDIWVSGTLGDGVLGLEAARGKLDRLTVADRACLVGRYRRPSPRLALGRALGGTATACLDVSDGIAGDAGHLARRSRVGLHIDTDSVPLSAPARRALACYPGLRDRVLSGGDDYELLFSAAPDDRAAVAAAAETAGVAVTRIGAAEQHGPGTVRFTDGQGRVLTELSGWRHF